MNFSKGKIARLLVIYFLMLIPLYVICIASTLKITTDLNNSVKEQVEYRLDRFEENFEELYNDFNMSSFLYSLNYSELSEGFMTENEINAYKGIEVIQDILYYEPNSIDVFAAYSNDKIYSSSGLSTDTVYFGDMYGYSDYDVQRATEFINSQEAGIAYFNSPSDSIFIFHFPILQKSGETQSSINYCVSDKVLIEMLQTLVDQTPSYVELITVDGEKYYFYNDGKNDLVKVSDFKEDKTPYNMISSEIDSTGIQVSVFNSESSFYQEVEEQQSEYIIITLVGFLISVILVLFVYRKSCISIQSLMEHVQNRTVTNKGFWGFLETSVDEIIKESDEWKTTAEVSKFHLMQQIVFQLFNGLYKDRDSVNKMLEFYEKELFEEHYCLIGIFVDDDKKFLTVLQELEDVLFCKINIQNTNAFIVLHELPSFDYSRKLREQEVLKYKTYINQAKIEKSGFVISFVQNEIGDINQSYLEILRCLEQMHGDYNEKMKFLEHFNSKESENLKLINDELEKYKHALQNKNEKKIIELIKSINTFITDNSYSKENIVYIRYSISQLLLQSLKEEHNPSDNVIKSLNRSGAEFEKEILALVSKYFKSNKQDFNNIISYIQNNHHRYDLSLEEVSVYGGFTKTYLSKLFKVKTSMGYIEYLSKLRMEKAHELLKETNMSLKEVVEKVGYVDVSAFRRKFKATFGYSVSDVKKIN